MNERDVAQWTDALGQWRTGDGPLAERLTRRLLALVEELALPDGTLLPAERALAGALGVSRATVGTAYARARDAGRLASRQGSGYRVVRSPRPARPGDLRAIGAGADAGAAGPSGAFRTLGRPVAGIVDLSLAEPRCDHHTRALLERLGPDWPLHAVRGTGYHPQGTAGLRALVAERFGTATGRPTSPEEVLVTTGAQQGISLCATTLAPAGATVLVEEATYPGAIEAFRRAGHRVLTIPSDPAGPLPEALADLLVRTRPALVYLVPVGHNPTGRVVPAPRLDALAEVLARSGALLLEDRTAAPLGAPGTVPLSLSSRLPTASTVTIGSLSKVAWAGLRVGWVITTRPAVAELTGARLAADLAGSGLAQHLAESLLPHVDELAAAVRTDLVTRHEALGAALAARLPDWDGPEPAAGGWRWVRIPGDARALGAAAAAHGVLVTPGPAFSPHGGLTDRVRIAAVAEPAALTEGVRRLALAWADVAGRPTPDPGGPPRPVI